MKKRKNRRADGFVVSFSLLMERERCIKMHSMINCLTNKHRPLMAEKVLPVLQLSASFKCCHTISKILTTVCLYEKMNGL